MNSSIQLRRAPNHSLEQRVNDYMRPFHTASCQEHLIGALQQLPKSATFAREQSSIREHVALRLLQEVIVMGAQEQEALDACLVTCGPLESLSACATTLQEIAAHKNNKKKKKKHAVSGASVESPSILETALRTIRRWLVKGVSFPPEYDPSDGHNSYYQERCWVEQVADSLSLHISNNNNNNNYRSSYSYNYQDTTASIKDVNSPLVQACLENLTRLVSLFPFQISNACHALGVQLPSWAIGSRYNPRLIEGALSMALYQQEKQQQEAESSSSSSSYSAQYFKLLVQQMVRSRNPDDVALGLYKYHERHYRGGDSCNNNISTNDTSGKLKGRLTTQQQQPKQQPKALCQLLLQLHRHTLSPRESAYLLRSIMISSIPRQSHATEIATTQLTQLWQNQLYPYMELSCRPILVASKRVREAFVRLLVLSPSSVLTEEWPDRLFCHCVASLLANPIPLVSSSSSNNNNKKQKSSSTKSSSGKSGTTASRDNSSDSDDDSSTSSSSSTDRDSSDEDDTDTGSPIDEALQHHAWLAKHVQEVIGTWSLAVFVRQTDYRLQRHVTNFLLSGMCFLQLQHDKNNCNTTLVGGTTGTSHKGAPPMSVLVAGLLEGVTVRLESSIPAIRKDGMMIAERLAQKMGQELQFEELDDAEGTLADDDEVTFLQSVMTAAEFPSHYYSETLRGSSSRERKTNTTNQSQSRNVKKEQRQQEERQPEPQEEQQRQHNKSRKKDRKTEKEEKKSKKKKEKEERRKRRKAKQEAKSDTRILDAVYGNLKSSAKQQKSCRDSYEDSYDDFYGNQSQEVSQHESAAAAPRSDLHHQLQAQTPLQHLDQQRSRAQPHRSTQRNNKHKYDSYDNSSTQENQYRAPIQENLLYQEQAPLSDPAQFPPSQNYGIPREQQHVFQEQQQQPQLHEPLTQRYVSPLHQAVDHYEPLQPLQSRTQPQQPNVHYHHIEESEVQMPSYGSIEDDGLQHHGQGQSMDYTDYNEQKHQDADGHLHVRWENPDHVILTEAEELQQERYWKNQLKQQRRQRHYQQQRNVERELQKQQQQQQEWKKKEKERQEQATQNVASRTSQFEGTTPKSPREKSATTVVDEDHHSSPRRRQPQNVVDMAVAAHGRHKEEFQDEEEEEEEGIESEAEENESEEDENVAHNHAQGEEKDDDGIAACWTRNEVEMVLENGLPRHSPSSPLRYSRSPRHSVSPRHIHGERDSPRKTTSPWEAPEFRNSDDDRSKDVPSLIFAMVDDDANAAEDGAAGQSKSSNSDTRKADFQREVQAKQVQKKKDEEEEETIDEIVSRRLRNDKVRQGKPPLSPRSRKNQDNENEFSEKPSRRLQKPRSNPSKDSHTSVRSRRHPQVDPAEIDARILAAAYDHESAASSKSAPALSVYSSSSSEDLSVSLADPRARRNEASQMATRSPKQQAYTNAYEHIKKKKQQRRMPDETPRHRSPIIFEGRTPKAPDKHVLMVDPDAAYVSEEEEEEDEGSDEDFDENDDEFDDDDDYSRSTEDGGFEEEYSDEGSRTRSYSDEEDDYDDDDSAWDESEHRHLHAYDVEDDEEDLREIPKPRYLRDCLELLRAPESDNHASSKHEAALKWLPQIIQGDDKAADLPDLAVPLALELIRMEDKFNIENFEDDKIISVIALMVAEPLAVGQRLILLLWEDIAFMDRLDILTALSEAAFELSGNKELEEWHASKNTKLNERGETHGKRAYVKENYSLLSCKDSSTFEGTEMGSMVSVHAERALGHVESKTRRWGRGRRQQETHAFRSRFGPVAHVWYYSLVGGFLKRKDSPALWGGAVGARLLANLFVTLATIVECSGVAPGTGVLAKDLFDLVWSFRTVDVAEVRMGVLVAVAAALSCLSEEDVLTMMFDGSLSSLPEGLKQMSQLDPDENCRRLAQSMAPGISGIVDSLQPVGRISKASFSSFEI